MSDKSKKPSAFQEGPTVSAVEVARDMLCELSGQRGWHDTRESWLARGARRAGLSLRRARAIFYNEKIRLDADEYLGIERAWQSASASLATLSNMASAANVRRSGGSEPTGGMADAGSGRVDAPARGGPAAGIQVRR